MLNCPACGAKKSTVVDSRATDQSTRRRRKCVKCDERWTTYEVSSAAFAALTELDAALDAAGANVRAAAEGLAKVREDARQIRDDYGITAYQPVREGDAGPGPAAKRHRSTGQYLPLSDPSRPIP